MFLTLVIPNIGDWNTYACAGTVLMLLFNTILSCNYKISRFASFMLVAMVLHFFLTPDKVTAVFLMVSNLLLFEIMKQYEFSYKIVIYPFLCIALFAFILTLPQLLHVIFESHVSRSTLYEGIFYNSNSASSYYIVVVLCTLLFVKTPYLRLLFLAISLLIIVASGCRSGLLTLFTASLFYILLKSKFHKFTIYVFFFLLFAFTYYLVFIEGTSAISFDYMGKGGDSAGRSAQIIYIINKYSVNLFGYGKNIINADSVKNQGFAVHNFWICSLYSSGLIILLGYTYFMCKLFYSVKSHVAKAFLLSLNLAFFFEPGVCYYISFSNIFPIVVVLLQEGQEQVFQKQICECCVDMDIEFVDGNSIL